MNCKTCFNPCDTTSGYCSIACMSTSLGTNNNSYTCSANERAFLDEIRENGKWVDAVGEGIGIELSGESILFCEDFTKSNLKDLVNE